MPPHCARAVAFVRAAGRRQAVLPRSTPSAPRFPASPCWTPRCGPVTTPCSRWRRPRRCWPRRS
ncbi:MAG: hypothetical protein MZW92_30610 [Comamonadaceae bacterium]|nr:hypothetical protein [Comamonadaceae bacterium]